MPAVRRDPLDVLGLVVACVLALGIGVFVGAVTTFTHRQWVLAIGPVPLPLGLIAGVLVVGAVVAGFRLAFDSRVVALAAAVGAVGVAAVLALPGAGGSALVVADALGWSWAIGPTLVAAVVLAWPRRIRPAHAGERTDGAPARD